MKTQGGVRLNQEKEVEVNHAAALKWVLKDENVCTTIPGITTFDQMDLDFGVMGNLELSAGRAARPGNLGHAQRTPLLSELPQVHPLLSPGMCRSPRSCVPSCTRKATETSTRHR